MSASTFSGEPDPFWVEITTPEVEVIMLAGHARVYQEWLRGCGLHLFTIPGAGQESIPVLGVGVRD